MKKATIYDYARMCKFYDDCNMCPFGDTSCRYVITDNPDKANEIILKWCDEHSIETRQDRFLKMFPNTCMVDGIIEIFPCAIEKDSYISDSYSCSEEHDFNNCAECRKKYWLTEVDENE